MSLDEECRPAKPGSRALEKRSHDTPPGTAQAKFNIRDGAWFFSSAVRSIGQPRATSGQSVLRTPRALVPSLDGKPARHRLQSPGSLAAPGVKSDGPGRGQNLWPATALRPRCASPTNLSRWRERATTRRPARVADAVPTNI